MAPPGPVPKKNPGKYSRRARGQILELGLWPRRGRGQIFHPERRPPRGHGRICDPRHGPDGPGNHGICFEQFTEGGVIPTNRF